MYHINNLKVKELRVLIQYYFGSGKCKEIPKKLELVEAITDFLIKYWEGLVHREGYGKSVVTNEAGREAGEETG